MAETVTVRAEPVEAHSRSAREFKSSWQANFCRECEEFSPGVTLNRGGSHAAVVIPVLSS